ncbi:MAG: C4-dicarboxylate ABC transporter [Marinilabiliales bacterium]|mgnify:CR=1 FL=1|nr:MAG: C4-dicarboxylate ABC transporter [Marinilabiliales bacterium]
MKEKLQFFPITLFAVIMGLSGLTIVFGKFYHMQWMPKIIYDSLLFITFGLFILISFLYGLKAIKHFEEVVKDFRHKIRINFFSAISISFLLLSIAFMTYWPFLSMLMWWVGLIMHTIMMLHTISFWIQHNFEIQFMNPAWFIPVVGNILVPVAGVEYMPKAFSFIYFAIGFFFWIILFAIFLYRAVFHHQLPQKFIPTLFILIAPPAVGFIAYIRIAQSWDTFAVFMLFMAYFFTVLLLFLYKSFRKLKFFISWWAFTFPMMAITIASVVAFQVSGQEIYKYLAFILLIPAIFSVGFVAYKTIIRIKRGEICINED